MPDLNLRKLTKIGLELLNTKVLPMDDKPHDGLSAVMFRTWRSHYGHRPKVIFDAWCLIEEEAKKLKCKPKHFFWALHFMKCYDVEDNLSSKFGVTPKTFRKWVKEVMSILAQCFYSLVRIF